MKRRGEESRSRCEKIRGIARTKGNSGSNWVKNELQGGPLGALLSSPALDVRLMTALQVLQEKRNCDG